MGRGSSYESASTSAMSVTVKTVSMGGHGHSGKEARRTKVHLLGGDNLGLLDVLESKVDCGNNELRVSVISERLGEMSLTNEGQGKGNVKGDKVGNVESGSIVGEEYGESGEDHDDRGGDQHVPCRKGLEWSVEGERTTVDPLCLHSLVEAEVGDRDSGPGRESSNSSHVGKPIEDLTRTLGDTHIGKERETGGDGEGHVWETVLGGASKDLGCVTRYGKSVEGTGRGVHVGGSSGPRRGQQAGVDDGGKTTDSSGGDGNDEGRLGRSRVENEGRVVGGHDETDAERSQEVEDQDTDVHTPDGSWNVTTGVLGLSSSDGDDLGTDVRERGLDEDGEETKKLSEGSGDTAVLSQRTYESPKTGVCVSNPRSATCRSAVTHQGPSSNGIRYGHGWDHHQGR